MKKLKYLVAIPLLGSLLFSCSSGEIKEENTSANETNEVAPVKKDPETIEEFEAAIRNNKEWMEGIEKKAADRNVSVDEVIKEDAKWMLNKKMKDSPEAQIDKLVNKIKKDSVWSYKTRLQAEERGVSFDEMVYLNAEYTYNKRKKNEQ